MRMGLSVVRSIYHDPYLKRSDTQDHQGVRIIFEGGFDLAGGDRSTGVVDLDVDGNIEYVYCDESELPQGVHALAASFRKTKFPTEPQRFVHKTMRPHLRRLAQRVAQSLEMTDCIIMKRFAPKMHKVLQDAIDAQFCLFNHPVCICIHICTLAVEPTSPASRVHTSLTHSCTYTCAHIHTKYSSTLCSFTHSSCTHIHTIYSSMSCS